MPQSQISGAAANDFGRKTASLVAVALGTKLASARSNEAQFHGRRVVIKCARYKTTSVGVTYKMQKSLDEVLGAFEVEPGEYKVFELPIATFIKFQRPSKSKGASVHQVGLVSRSEFVKRGKFLVSLPLSRGDA